MQVRARLGALHRGALTVVLRSAHVAPPFSVSLAVGIWSLDQIFQEVSSTLVMKAVLCGEDPGAPGAMRLTVEVREASFQNRYFFSGAAVIHFRWR